VQKETGMTKNTKKQTKRTKRTENAKLTAAQRCALQQREAHSLVIGMDLGDRVSWYCVRTLVDQARVIEGSLATTPQAMAEFFGGWQRQRIVIETGTHSRWVAQLLDLMGHEVVVGNARKLALITQNDRKSDKVDAGLLSKLGCIGVEWLHPVYVRREAAQRDLTMVRAREALVEARTALINHIRGQVKSFGCRISMCDGSRFAAAASEEMPEALRSALSRVLDVVGELEEQINGYDCEVKQACATKYPETKWLLQINGVGPLTALTYVLTIDDAKRFEKSRDGEPGSAVGDQQDG